MNNIQWRHIKLSFAGTAQNWELAAYELRQLKAGLEQAAVMYDGIPVTNVADDDGADRVDRRCRRRKGRQAVCEVVRAS